jgi:uncharacterized protein YrrD
VSTQSIKSKSGQTVVALDTAEEIGKVKHFVVSSDVNRIERLHIDGRRKNAVFAEWSDIESFGPDRVMVTTEGSSSQSDDDRDIDAAKGKIDLIGSRVLDTAGFEHGTVADATFDGSTGQIADITLSDGRTTAAAHVHSLGSYAVVIDVLDAS